MTQLQLTGIIFAAGGALVAGGLDGVVAAGVFLIVFALIRALVAAT